MKVLLNYKVIEILYYTFFCLKKDEKRSIIEIPDNTIVGIDLTDLFTHALLSVFVFFKVANPSSSNCFSIFINHEHVISLYMNGSV